MVVCRLLVLLTGILFSMTAQAFEVKGYTPGMDASTLDLKACRPLKDADSGVPGYACDTTVGGDPASVRVLVFEGKVVGVIFTTKNAHMKPILDALSEKYGRPTQSNRYIENYNWRNGRLTMSLKEKKLDRGYDILLIDFDLFAAAQKSAKDKAKSDI